MGELTEVTEQLSELEGVEEELERAKSRLDKKESTVKLDSLQAMVIKYQREAISALLRILKERESVGNYWENLTSEVISLRGTVDEANKALGDMKDKKTKELEKQLEASTRAIASLREDVEVLGLRVKVLVGR